MNKISSKFLSNFTILLIGSLGSKLITFFLVPYYTNILSTSEYGVIDIINTNSSILALLIAIGIPDAIFRFTMSEECDSENVLKNGMIITTVLACILTTILLLVNILLKWSYMECLIMISISSVYYSLLSNYIKAKQLTIEYVMIGLLQTVLVVIFNIIFLSKLHWGIIGYLYTVIISNILPLVIMIFYQKIYLFKWNVIDIKLCRRMLRYGLPLIFSTISWWVITSCDRYMLLYFYDEEQVGIYSVATRIPLILQTVIALLDTVWQISVNEIYDTEKNRLAEMFNEYMAYFRTIGFVGCTFVILFTKPIMMFIARNDFYEGWRYAPVLILSMIFPFSCGMSSTLYKAYEANEGLMKSVILGCIVNIVLNLLLIKPLGIMGAALATMISRCVISMYQLIDTERFLAFDRGYKDILLNSLLLVAQSYILISFDEYGNTMQIVFVILILILNIRVLKKIIKSIWIYLYTKIK